jgi:hypothetical protein
MTNYANRLDRLETVLDSDCPVRFVWMAPGETEQDAFDRCTASADDANALRRARTAGRICFMSWADARA